MMNELIEAVKEHKELYDTKNYYMKTKLKNEIWCDIAKKLKLKDGEEAKYVWFKLRARYHHFRQQHRKNQIARPWKYQKQMSFLEPFILIGSAERNDNDENEVNDDSQPLPENSKNVFQGMDVETDNNEEMSIIKIEQSNEVITDDEAISVDVGEDESIAKNRRTEMLPSINMNSPEDANITSNKTNSDILSLLNRSIEVRENRAKQREEERRRLLEEKEIMKDPLYNFFLSMYQSTKGMSSLYQHQIKCQIFRAVSDAEANMNISISQPDVDSFKSMPHLLQLNHEHQIKEEPSKDSSISSV